MRRLTFSNLLAHCGLLAAGLLVYHLILRLLMSENGLRLGAISYKLAPLYAYWRPNVKGWLLIPVAVLAIYFSFLRRTHLATSLSDRAALLSFVTFFIAICTSVAMLDGGPKSLIAPLLRADLEYFGAIDRVHGIADFLRDYPQLSPTMPMHAQVHPPGAILFLWLVTKVLGGGPYAAAAGIILFSSLSIVVVFFWAKRLGGPGVARRAAAVFLLTPSVVLFTATSMDGPFAVFLIAAMWLFWESLGVSSQWSVVNGQWSVVSGQPSSLSECDGHRIRNLRGIAFGILAGQAATAAALMTYSVTVVFLFCGLAACVSWFAIPTSRSRIITACLIALTSFLGAHVLLWLATGYDPVQMFLTAVANSNYIMSGTRHDSIWRYAHIVVANLVVFFIAAGLSCAVLWWPTVLRSFTQSGQPTDHRSPITDHRSMPGQGQNEPAQDPIRLFTITAAFTVLIAAVVPVYVLEVERVWMFLTPFVAIPVAWRLFDEERCSGKIGAALPVTALLAVQTLLTEVFLTTYW